MKQKIPRVLKYSDIGMAQFNRVYNKISPILQFATLLGVYGIYLSKEILVLVSFGVVCLSVLVGLIWVRSGLLRAELDVDQKQSPIYLKLCELERKLNDEV